MCGPVIPALSCLAYAPKLPAAPPDSVGSPAPAPAPDSVLLPKGAVLAVARLAAPSRAQLYTLDGAPAWLDARAGRPDDLSPTVRACGGSRPVHSV